MIKPHGGKLVDRIIPESKNITDLESLILSQEEIRDVKNIARGVYSPLEGFLKEKDFKKVVSEMKLSNGIVWPIPITLSISKEDKERLEKKDKIVLINSEKQPIGFLENPEIYSYDKEFFAKNVFGTINEEHPGVRYVFEMKEYLIGGKISLFQKPKDLFPEYNLIPSETREIFEKRGWKTIVAFQTRNVPHRGHEFLQKEALKGVDGLFIQPVIGKKKINDFKDEYILTSYEILIDKHYSRKRVVLGILPLKMRYAGPREAVFHAIIRKNYGCTHFIVGRDHAGVGDFYDPFAAQKIFNNFKENEIGVKILKFPEVVYCSSIKQHTFIQDCPKEDIVSFSGTKLRKNIEEKKETPNYIIRPEIFNFLTNSYNSLVDNMYNNNHNGKGFVLWFTGLSQSGKTTTADKVYKILSEKGLKLERLDGDIVRQHLSKDLGFSKEDRNENIRRISFISKLLSRNGVGVIASFISPYKETREMLRKETNNFIEVFCDCPLEVCEKRDTKCLYKKAREGKIQNFTGISDPYEKPENPEIHLDTSSENNDQAVEEVISYLEKNNFI